MRLFFPPGAVWLVALLGCGGGAAASGGDGGNLAGAGGHGADGGNGSNGGNGGDGGSGGSGGDAPSHPDVARVGVPASFLPVGDGSYRFEGGLEVFDVTKAFYADHPDAYDFVVVYTDFLIQDIWQFELTTRADIGGIGQDIIYQEHYGWPLDWYVEAGSDGALQAVVFMNHRSLWDAAAFSAQEILTHEVGHRWGASVLLPQAGDPMALLDASLSHWSRVAGVGGPSALGYGELVDNGDGTFTHERVSPLRYAPLELYAMGLVPATDPSLVGLFHVTGAPDPDAVNAGGPVTFAGTRVDLSIADIVAGLGPRTPSFVEAQTAFRFAFVLVCDGACDEASLAWVDAQRESWPETFAAATGRRATADTHL
jgi:hypothetical protein